MIESVAAPASRRSPTIYRAVGLQDDPFPRDPEAGVFVELAPQMAVFAGIRSWLDAPFPGDPGLAVIAGGSGSGKTRLLGRLIESLVDDDRLIGVVPGNGSRRSDAQLLRAAIGALGGAPAGRTGLELTTELRAILDAHRGDPMPPALLIDNAALTGSQLEIVRNILTATGPGAGQTRVQIVLFGPPELPDRITRRRSLTELTRTMIQLSPLDRSAIVTLLTTRVAAVRDRDADPLFTADALRAIGETSQGNPGAALALAQAAVREAIATGKQVVDAVVAHTVAAAFAARQGPSIRAQGTGDEGAIQTRLSLPGIEDGAGTAAAPRRRRRQR